MLFLILQHREICSKTFSKKRKAFDMTKKRAQGTELEQFARKGATGGSRGARGGKVSGKSHNNAMEWTGRVGKNVSEIHTRYDLYGTG